MSRIEIVADLDRIRVFALTTTGRRHEAWLMHGLVGRDPHTVANRTSLARTHVIRDSASAGLRS
jgi:hypothetical protein